MVIRITGYTFDLMKRSMRKQRAYKIEDIYYEAAQKKAAMTEKPLAVRVEEFVIKYAGVEKTPYFAAMGDLVTKKSKSK